ncbi:MAG: hypothetical protein RIR48_444, partial [Bacteroidota bacterium]
MLDSRFTPIKSLGSKALLIQVIIEINHGRNKSKCKKIFFSRATAIHTRKFRIPSDLRRQAGNGSVSTMVGDHMGILS